MADELPRHDSYSTPIILVDGIHGMQLRDGLVALNLTLTQFAVPGSEIDGSHVVAVARLNMPVGAFMRLADFMQSQRDQLIKDGHVVVEGGSIREDKDVSES